MLREEIKNDTPLGKEAKGYMNLGKLVPDKLVFEIIENALKKPECRKVMFDGFPRNEEQAKKLDETLEKLGKKLAAVVYLDVKDQDLIERSTGRRIHQASGRTYHIKFKKPKVDGKDDVTGEPLIQRDDDKEEVIKKRLVTFHECTKAVLKHYEEKKLVYKIDGNRSIPEVWKDVEAKLDEAFAQPKPDEKPASADAKVITADAKANTAAAH